MQDDVPVAKRGYWFIGDCRDRWSRQEKSQSTKRYDDNSACRLPSWGFPTSEAHPLDGTEVQVHVGPLLRAKREARQGAAASATDDIASTVALARPRTTTVSSAV